MTEQPCHSRLADMVGVLTGVTQPEVARHPLRPTQMVDSIADVVPMIERLALV